MAKISMAQRRSVWQQIVETANVPKHLSEQFSKAYGRQMTAVRQVDEAVLRDAQTLRPMLKEAGAALKQQRWLDVVHYVNGINEVVKQITSYNSVLTSISEEQIVDFYGGPEARQVFDMNADYFGVPAMGVTATAEVGLRELVKEAGLLDFMLSDRARAAKMLEKMYARKLAVRKRAVERMYEGATALVSHTISTYKKLDKARARGNISEYMGELQALEQIRSRYDAQFRNDYSQHIAPMVAEIRNSEMAIGQQGSQPAPRPAPAPVAQTVPGPAAPKPPPSPTKPSAYVAEFVEESPKEMQVDPTGESEQEATTQEEPSDRDQPKTAARVNFIVVKGLLDEI